MKTSASTFWDFGSIPMIEPEFLGNILATSSDIAVMIDLMGSIKSVLVNQSEQYYGDLSHWEGKNITKFLTMDSVPKIERALDKLNSGQTILHSIELNHQDNAKWQFPVRYNAHLVGQNDNILLLGRDLRSISETQQQLVKAQIAVEQSHEERKEYDAHYRSIFSTANEPIFVLDAKTAKIRQANPAACTLLGEDIDAILSETFGKFVVFKDKKDLIDKMAMAAMSKTTLRVIISHNGQDTEASLHPVIYRASGQQVLLVRLNLDKNQANLNDPLSQNLIDLYKNGTDGIVFTNASGVISFVNESFLELINTAQGSEIVGRSLGDFLSKGQIDLAVMLENVQRVGQMRIYSTDLKNDFGLKTAVEVSMTQIAGIHPNKCHLLLGRPRALSHLDPLDRLLHRMIITHLSQNWLVAHRLKKSWPKRPMLSKKSAFKQPLKQQIIIKQQQLKCLAFQGRAYMSNSINTAY